MPAPFVRRVFVYGSLRRGEQRDIYRLLSSPCWVGRASVAGVMHDLGAYPGVMLRATGLVRGEVYQISVELERRLDEIEEVWPESSGEYAKREFAVQLDLPSSGASAQLICVLYEVAPARVSGKLVIAGGDWVQSRA